MLPGKIVRRLQFQKCSVYYMKKKFITIVMTRGAPENNSVPPGAKGEKGLHGGWVQRQPGEDGQHDGGHHATDDEHLMVLIDNVNS